MQNISRFLLALPLLLCPLPSGAQELPLDIEIDLAVTALESAVVAEDHAGVLDHIERLRALDPALGDGELLYFEAVAASEMGDLDRMETALTRFLTEVGRQSDSYTDALAMMQELRTARAGQAAVAEGLAEGIAALEAENYAEALRLLRPLAEAGEAQAQHEIGRLYSSGRGVERDQEEGVRWQVLAAEEGYAPAQVSLGLAYGAGSGGLEQDLTQAAYWVRMAAEQGYTRGQTFLGSYYLRGWGVAQDFGLAMHWFRLSADAGDSDGLRYIGDMYRDGLSVAQDFDEAIRHYRLAGATISMAELYERGLGVPQDFTEAARIYRAEVDAGWGFAFAGDLQRLEEHVLDSGDWHVHEASDRCYIHTYASDAARYPYLILSEMQFSASRSSTGGSLLIRMVFPNPFDAARPVSASVDGQRFDLEVDGMTVRSGSSGTALTRAIRAGQSVTVSGTSLTGKAISVTFSAAGFTRAFNEMARLCNRPDIQRWIQ